MNKLVDVNMGLGLNVYGFEQGFTNQKGIKVGYAYRAFFSEDKFLSFGLSVDLFKFQFDQDLVKIKNPDDPTFTNQPSEQTAIDFDFGLSFNTPRFFFDVAIHQVPGRKLTLLNDFADDVRARHYFAYTGYKIPLSNTLELEPSVFFKYIEAGIFHSDLGMKALYNDLLWVGAYYRTNNIIVGHAGIKLDRLSYGFAYEYGLDELFNYSVGTWEFQFIYFINKSKPKLDI